MAFERLLDLSNDVEDPCCGGKVEHRLTDILVIAVCAVIACAESWDDIALYGCNKLRRLRTFLDCRTASLRTTRFRRVFMLIDSATFEAAFLSWVGRFVRGFDPKVVAIDGTTVRRSFDRGREQNPLHLVSAWASQQGLVLGQCCEDGKSNEIAAIPALLDQLMVKNSIVTLDAMGCQTVIAQKILDRGADYLPALKGNHRQAYQAVADYFTGACVDRDAPVRAVLDEFDDGHGRLVRRRVFVSNEAGALETLRSWPGLHAVLAVQTSRSVNGTAKTVAEWRCYLTSRHDEPEVLAGAIRKHWTIESVPQSTRERSSP